MKLSQLKIDPEFQSKIPPLQFEEEQQLEQNIIAEGRESYHHKEWLHSGWAHPLPHPEKAQFYQV